MHFSRQTPYCDELILCSHIYPKSNYGRFIIDFERQVYEIIYKNDKVFENLVELEKARGFLIE